MCGGAKVLEKIKSVPFLLNDPTGGYLTGGVFDKKGATNESVADLIEGVGNRGVKAWDLGAKGDWEGAAQSTWTKSGGYDVGEEGAESRRARQDAADTSTPEDTSGVDSYAMANTGLGVGIEKRKTRKHGMRQNILTSGQGLQLS